MPNRPLASPPSSPPAPEPPVATRRVGLVGARGHAGAELLRLVHAHPALSHGWAASRSRAGAPLADVAPALDPGLSFVEASPARVAEDPVDVLVLALPNGAAAPYVEAAPAETVVVDLSADHRFDDAWTYGAPELNADALRGARRIANPGCYATAMLLALAPIAADLDGVPAVFGVSGYSGAGTTPSPRNDPAVLRDNVVPYQLADHVHEREVSRHLGHAVRFAPHVAPFFRGLTVTVLATLAAGTTPAALATRYERFYATHPLVRTTGAEPPLARDAAHRCDAAVGGLAVGGDDPRRVAVVAALDNLLKGAASQAVQNINLACGLAPREGIPS